MGRLNEHHNSMTELVSINKTLNASIHDLKASHEKLSRSSEDQDRFMSLLASNSEQRYNSLLHNLEDVRSSMEKKLLTMDHDSKVMRDQLKYLEAKLKDKISGNLVDVSFSTEKLDDNINELDRQVTSLEERFAAALLLVGDRPSRRVTSMHSFNHAQSSAGNDCSRFGCNTVESSLRKVKGLPCISKQLHRDAQKVLTREINDCFTQIDELVQRFEMESSGRKTCSKACKMEVERDCHMLDFCYKLSGAIDNIAAKCSSSNLVNSSELDCSLAKTASWMRELQQIAEIQSGAPCIFSLPTSCACTRSAVNLPA